MIDTGIDDALFMEIVEKLEDCTECESHPKGCEGCEKFKESNNAFNGLCEKTRLSTTKKETFNYYLKVFSEIGCIG